MNALSRLEQRSADMNAVANPLQVQMQKID